MVQINLTASTNLHSMHDFRDLIVKQNANGYLRSSDVANVTLGAEDYDLRSVVRQQIERDDRYSGRPDGQCVGGRGLAVTQWPGRKLGTQSADGS